ncbi:MAG: sigma-70 family RNA polymerase sigma factor [Micavibrio sp.]|nr:sigma-70 family RNA polymerase sigma factor [Micavibrio sp.]
MDKELQETDESLMARVCNGEHQAFAVLTERYTDMFFAAAYRMCGERGEAEDIVQDALLKLWIKPQSYDSSRGVKLSTWLYRVVSNLAIDRMRKRKGEYVAADGVIEGFEDDRIKADKKLEMDQEQRLLEEAIQSLPERQKVALNLCFYEGVSNKEAAEILEVGVKGLESLLMRAKAALREKLADYREELGRDKNYG